MPPSTDRLLIVLRKISINKILTSNGTRGNDEFTTYSQRQIDFRTLRFHFKLSLSLCD